MGWGGLLGTLGELHSTTQFTRIQKLYGAVTGIHKFGYKGHIDQVHVEPFRIMCCLTGGRGKGGGQGSLRGGSLQ